MTNSTDLEYPACPMCDSAQRETLYADIAKGYNVVRCKDCAMHYLYPRLNEAAITRFYQGDEYFAGGDSGYSDTSYEDQERSLRATFSKMMQHLKTRGLTGGSLLEIGCGYGYLLQEAEGYFDRRVGTEFSSEGV